MGHRFRCFRFMGIKSVHDNRIALLCDRQRRASFHEVDAPIARQISVVVSTSLEVRPRVSRKKSGASDERANWAGGEDENPAKWVQLPSKRTN